MIMVNSLSALYETLSDQVEKTIYENVAKEIEYKLKSYIRSRVYNAYRPTTYYRTYELLDSLSIMVESSKKNEFIVSIFSDSKKMNHTSWANGNPSVYVATCVNDGGTVGRPRADFILYTMNDLEKNKTYIKEFKNVMRKKGYIVL